MEGPFPLTFILVIWTFEDKFVASLQLFVRLEYRLGYVSLFLYFITTPRMS